MRLKHPTQTSAHTSLHENLADQHKSSPNRTAQALGASLLLELSTARQSNQAACGPYTHHQPFVSLIDKIQCTDDIDGILFRYEPMKDKHFVYAKLDENNELSFGIRAEGDRSTLGSGTDMFMALMEKINQEKLTVDKVRADWQSDTKSVNAEAFRGNRANGLGLTQSVMNTWTGRRLKEYGFHPFSIEQYGHCCYVTFSQRHAGLESDPMEAVI